MSCRGSWATRYVEEEQNECDYCREEEDSIEEIVLNFEMSVWIQLVQSVVEIACIWLSSFTTMDTDTLPCLEFWSRDPQRRFPSSSHGRTSWNGTNQWSICKASSYNDAGLHYSIMFAFQSWNDLLSIGEIPLNFIIWVDIFILQCWKLISSDVSTSLPSPCTSAMPPACLGIPCSCTWSWT